MNDINQLSLISKSNIKLSEFLESEMMLSNRKAREYFKKRKILVNGKYESRSSMLKSGDRISVVLEEETFDELPFQMNISVIYEDEYYMAVEKPAGLSMFKSENNDEISFSSVVANLFVKRGIKRKVRFINRLDKFTSGVVLVAKNDIAHSAMATKWNSGHKEYLLAVKGEVNENFDIGISLKYDDISKKYIKANHGKDTKTKYFPLGSKDGATLLKAILITGKTHQIRAQMSDLGLPLLGDALYGEECSHRQALHSYSISILHPFLKRVLVIQGDLPNDFIEILEEYDLYKFLTL